MKRNAPRRSVIDLDSERSKRLDLQSRKYQLVMRTIRSEVYMTLLTNASLVLSQVIGYMSILTAEQRDQAFATFALLMSGGSVILPGIYNLIDLGQLEKFAKNLQLSPSKPNDRKDLFQVACQWSLNFAESLDQFLLQKICGLLPSLTLIYYAGYNRQSDEQDFITIAGTIALLIISLRNIQHYAKARQLIRTQLVPFTEYIRV